MDIETITEIYIFPFKIEKIVKRESENVVLVIWKVSGEHHVKGATVPGSEAWTTPPVSSYYLMFSWYRYKKNRKIFPGPGGADLLWRETELQQNIISRKVLASGGGRQNYTKYHFSRGAGLFRRNFELITISSIIRIC